MTDDTKMVLFNGLKNILTAASLLTKKVMIASQEADEILKERMEQRDALRSEVDDRCALAVRISKAAVDDALAQESIIAKMKETKAIIEEDQARIKELTAMSEEDQEAINLIVDMTSKS